MRFLQAWFGSNNKIAILRSGSFIQSGSKFRLGEYAVGVGADNSAGLNISVVHAKYARITVKGPADIL